MIRPKADVIQEAKQKFVTGLADAIDHAYNEGVKNGAHFGDPSIEKLQAELKAITGMHAQQRVYMEEDSKEIARLHQELSEARVHVAEMQRGISEYVAGQWRLIRRY